MVLLAFPTCDAFEISVSTEPSAVVLLVLKFGWFKTLKAEAMIFKANRSLIWNFLAIDMSVSQKVGPVMLLRPSIPSQKAAPAGGIGKILRSASG